jgi:hypothetical protein
MLIAILNAMDSPGSVSRGRATARDGATAGQSEKECTPDTPKMLAITRKRSFLNIRRESVVSRRPIRRGNGAKNRPQGWQTAQLHPGGVIGGQP